MARERIYYHLSSKYMGKTKVLRPRYRQGMGMDFERDATKGIKRICAAPTIEGCIVSLSDYWKYYVYAVKAKRVDRMRPRWKVDDALATGEVWITRPRRFKYLGEIKIDDNGETNKVEVTRIMDKWGRSEIFEFNTKMIKKPKYHFTEDADGKQVSKNYRPKRF